MKGLELNKKEEDPLDATFIIDLFTIIFISIALSADNVLIIGMAIRKLPNIQHTKVFTWTIISIVLFYILFISIATLVMDIPYIKLLGGILLIWVSFKMLTDLNSESDSLDVKSAKNMREAVRIIVISNFIISFDNVLAISVIAKGNYYLIIFGVLICIMLLVFGSTLVAKLMNKLFIICYVGAGILAFTAFKMMLEDPVLQPYNLQDTGLCLFLTFDVLVIGLIWRIIKVTLLYRKKSLNS